MKQTKVLWLDTETTGLDPSKQDIIQLSGMVEIEGIPFDTFNFQCAPHAPDNIEESALKVHGIARETLLDYPKPLVVWNKFCRILDAHVNKYDKTDKFILAGYNVDFDLRFLQHWWRKCGHSYFGSYFEYKVFDVYPLVFLFAMRFKWDLPNHKLATICTFLDIPLQAHDAMADIIATREVYLKLTNALPVEWRP